MNRLFSSKYCEHLNPIEKSEQDLQDYFRENWSSIFPDLTFIKEEYTLSGNVRNKNRDGRIDIMAFNRKSKKFVVVELKKGHDTNIRGQANDYRDFIEDHFLEIYLDVKEELGVNIPQSSRIVNDDIELILIANDFAEKDIARAKKTDNITCIRYQWFESKDDLILLYEYLNNPPEEPTLTKHTHKVITKSSNNYPDYVVNNIRSLSHPDNLISKMLDYIQKKGQVSRGELKKVCVEKFGCLNEKSGAITGDLSTLKHIEFVKESGRGENSIIYFVRRKSIDEIHSKAPMEVNEKPDTLSLKVNNRSIKGGTVPAFFKSALEFLIESNLPINNLLPFATSSVRYLIAKKPIHQRGNFFRKPVIHKGYAMESHKSREQALKDLKKLLKVLGCKVI